jgi:hypothetical protein
MPSADPSYESRQGALIGLQVFLLFIALIMTALRVYSRIVIVHSLGPDDYIMALATVIIGIYFPILIFHAYESSMLGSINWLNDQCVSG